MMFFIFKSFILTPGSKLVNFGERLFIMKKANLFLFPIKVYLISVERLQTSNEIISPQSPILHIKQPYLYCFHYIITSNILTS